MKNIILAIETSCDETSVALISGREILSNVVSSQIDIHAPYGGVIPEVASRLHVEKITWVIEEALQQAHLTLKEVSGIAVTRGPGLIGSLHVGLQAAKTLAFIHQIPLIPVHHIAAHIYANNHVREMKYPALALVVSGGHTQLVYMKEELHFKIIGDTQDDAIGEAYDKVARIMGLPYPGGPQIDRLAKTGLPTYKLPSPKVDHPFNFSFSGLKTAVLNLVQQAERTHQPLQPAHLAASFQTVAIQQLIDKTLLALSDYSVVQVVLAGGVSANSYLRQEMARQIQLHAPQVDFIIPPMFLCTDNAAMIGLLGAALFERKRFANLTLGVDPQWSIDEQVIEG